jgi:hypothetical protein
MVGARGAAPPATPIHQEMPMKIDPQELARVAAAQPRLDMYTPIHKALRACMAQALLALGRLDVEDDAQVRATAAEVAALLDLCLAHVRHENDHVHVAIEARAAGASAAVAHDHDGHMRDAAALREAALALEVLAPRLRQLAADRLYGALALFVGENFVHMHIEETAHNAVLWARYTDGELMDIHDRLVAAIAPQEMAVVLRWMLPALPPAERQGLLAGMRTALPAPAFEGVLAIAQAHLPAGDWARLARGLGRAPVPGLVDA